MRNMEMKEVSCIEQTLTLRKFDKNDLKLNLFVDIDIPYGEEDDLEGEDDEDDLEGGV